MSHWLIVAVTVAYTGVAANEFITGKPQMGVVFLGYSLANLGLIWDVWR